MDQVRSALKRRGITLVEVVVSSLILALLSGMIFLTLQTMRATGRKLDSVESIRRSHLIARLHLADWLRGARTATPNQDAPDATTLVFQKPLVVNGQLQTDVLGNLVWSDFHTLSINDQGHLILQTTDGPKLLARLEQGATLETRALPSKVRVTLFSPATDQHEEMKSSIDLYITGEVAPGGP